MTTSIAANGSALPIDSLITQPSSNTPPPAANNQLGQNAFLQLLTTELSNQDPLKPMDDTQSVTQLAQFSALQSQTALSTSFQNFQSNFGVMQASTLLGKSVTVSTPNGAGNTSTQTGTVASIAVQNGQPFFTMNGSDGKAIADGNGQPLLFSTTQIVGIGNT
ncbi:MAG TPA: flagellar hook capping FlgD N-terminal domain-containing protein [Candidatus Baltobacteraceae bacterium]|jgi:flagellar basal-body rod modification protein FlgD